MQVPSKQAVMSEEEARNVSLMAGQVFRPTAPIFSHELFAGRIIQIQDVLDTIGLRGHHVLVFGERGVGKTSLASVVWPLMNAIGITDVYFSHVTANTTDTFSTLWIKVFEDMTWQEDVPKPFLSTQVEATDKCLRDEVGLPDDPTPDDVRRALAAAGRTVFIFDEFDRLQAKESRIFTDLIKMLTDYDIDATIVMVGVAETIQQLIRNHASITRSLVSIHMPRMNREELREIITKTAAKLKVKFDDDAADRIASLSHGLPHYPHLLGLYSVRAACLRFSRQITIHDVRKGVEESVRKADSRVKAMYIKASRSSRSDALYKQVLLACALSETDELGYFKQKDVIKPLSIIMDEEKKASSFQRHLGEFCKRVRGTALEKEGKQYRKLYRFKDPLLPPYVILRGLSKGMISEEQVRELTGAEI